MKNIRAIFTIALLLTIIGCTVDTEPTKIVEKYYHGLNLSDYDVLSEQLSNNFSVIEGTDTSNYNIDTYYNWFQWDSVFKPNYNIIETRTINDSLFITLSKSCKRIEFLHDDPLIYTVYTEISQGKIESIQTMSYQNADWNKWITRRDTLVASTVRDYPELDPFIYDQSKHGAITYIKAIKLWLQGDKF